jgi:hypothetical protein
LVVGAWLLVVDDAENVVVVVVVEVEVLREKEGPESL